MVCSIYVPFKFFSADFSKSNYASFASIRSGSKKALLFFKIVGCLKFGLVHPIDRGNAARACLLAHAQ